MSRKHPYTGHLDGRFDLPTGELRAIASHSTVTEVPAGTVLFEQGEVGREVVLLLDGELDVHVADEPVAHVSAPTVLGEMALVAHRPYRVARVTATSDTTVAVASTQEFNYLVGRCPRFAEYVKALAAQREHARAH